MGFKYRGSHECNSKYRGFLNKRDVQCRDHQVSRLCGNLSHKSTEVVDRNHEIVEVRVASNLFVEVLTSKLVFVQV